MNERLPAIHAAIEFVEGHLRSEIAVADIAAAAGYSLYHFIRTFNQTVHHTPYDYLMRRRLSEAARELLAGEGRIIDIALDFQFNNPETFSRAFKRMFDIQPSQWRQRGEIPYRSLMPRLTLAYLEHLNQGDFSRPVLVEQEEICLAGLMAEGGENRPQLWQDLEGILRGLPVDLGECQFYGISSQPPTQGGASFYFAGFETHSPESIPPPLALQNLPAGPRARFIHYGDHDTLPLTLDYVHHTWLPKSEYVLAHPIEIERFGPEWPVSRGAESNWAVYIPI